MRVLGLRVLGLPIGRLCRLRLSGVGLGLLRLRLPVLRLLPELRCGMGILALRIRRVHGLPREVDDDVIASM
nr:hypothetical protein ISGA_06305 [Gordonia sp. NB41Y]